MRKVRDKAKAALPDDSFAQEVGGYASSLWKDVTTIKGLPFATLDKAPYGAWVENLSGVIPGIDKKYLYDLCSFDTAEILSNVLGVVAVFFCLKKNDVTRLYEILGAMGITSIISANPIMGIIAVAFTAYAYRVKKMGIDKKAVLKGGTVSAISMALFSVLGLPLLIELVIVLVVMGLFKRKVLDNEQMLALIRGNLILASDRGKVSAKELLTRIEQNWRDWSSGTGSKRLA